MRKIDKLARSKEVLKKKAENDLLFFIESFIWIDNPVKGRIRFKPYPYQVQLITKDLTQHQHNVINKGRQLGLSTILAAYILWIMTFKSSKNIVVASPSLRVSKNMVKKIRRMHKDLPSWIRQKEAYNNLTELSYDNGSSVLAISGAAEALRSEALSELIIDEAAFVEGADEMFAAALPTLSTGGSSKIFSTPNGASGMFYELVEKARKPGSIFNLTEIDWTVHPDRDQVWRDQQDELLGERKARQENDLVFLGSGNQYFSGDLLDKVTRGILSPIKIEEDLMKIYEKPLPNAYYHISVDVSRGDGEDYSYINVLKLIGNTREQVAGIKLKIATYKLTDMVVKYAMYYNMATVIVDVTGLGYGVGTNLRDVSKYPNLVTFKSNPGLILDRRSRPQSLDRLSEGLEKGTFIIRDGDFIDESKQFIWRQNKPQAAYGANDDAVMGIAIGAYDGFRIEDFRKVQSRLKINRNKLIIRRGSYR